MNIGRRDAIRQFIESKGEANLTELQELYPNCSSMTLRRDLIRLEEEGYVKRVRGGAIALNRVVSGAEGLYSLRILDNVKGKMDIAQKAVEYIGQARSLYLDAGSTVMYLAKILPENHSSILTSGANTAIELSKNKALTVMLLGGELNHNTLSVSGGLAQHAVQEYNIEMAVMGSSGFSLSSGFTSGSFSENELKRAVLKKATSVVMLMDHSKIGRNMPHTFAALESIDVLITDEEPDGDIKNACKKSKVKLIY